MTGKRLSLYFLIGSIVFFLFLLTLTGYRIETTFERNLREVQVSFQDLVSISSSLALATGGYDSPYFKERMRDVFWKESRLLLLSVYSGEDGIQYLITRNRAYLEEPREITVEWRGKPAYRIHKGTEIRLSSSVLSAAKAALSFDGVFVVLGKEDVLPIIKDDLYLLLVFLIICSVFILLTSALPEETEKKGKPEAETKLGPLLRPETEPVTITEAAPAAKKAAPRMEAFPPTKPESSREPSPKALFSPETGLVWKEYFEERLKAELDRAASSDQDLLLAFIRMDEPGSLGRSDTRYRELAKLIQETFPIHDLIFETGPDSIGLIMPDIELDDGIHAVDSFRQKAKARGFLVSLGASSRNGRLISQSTLLEEVAGALEKAQSDGGDQVVGFRADPEKFRRANLTA